MGRQAVDGIIAIVTAVIALAIVGVLVSKGSNTGTIITSAGTAFSGVIKAATASVSGASSGLSLPSLGSLTNANPVSSPGTIASTVSTGGLE